MKIKYGLVNKNIDITDFCFTNLSDNNIIKIPALEMNRINLFSNPLPNILKKVIIQENNNIVEFEYYEELYINLNEKRITKINILENIRKLEDIHSNLILNYGIMEEEVPEQLMAQRFLTGKEKVLEIGGNIGRNSLVISTILEDESNLVVLESNSYIAEQLEENRDYNNFKFKIEKSALSKRKLIQRGWETIPSDTLLKGYSWVNTISIEELREKYKINFDTLVLDCEGAFYYILMDMPEILENIKLIIMENDYDDIKKYEYVKNKIEKEGFTRIYFEPGGWKKYTSNFYEVWEKNY